ncbi:amidohydrolase family protein [Paenibacillus faecalis]|uniref:amidohydrolase family protein n=1 Tax=Paenibacillus faecalis TaxID=2079532 RepID=UPI000D0EFFE7|nr:amidohydrolase family protein [Paenibacillus faecalis]
MQITVRRPTRSPWRGRTPSPKQLHIMESVRKRLRHLPNNYTCTMPRMALGLQMGATLLCTALVRKRHAELDLFNDNKYMWNNLINRHRDVGPFLILPADLTLYNDAIVDDKERRQLTRFVAEEARRQRKERERDLTKPKRETQRQMAMNNEGCKASAAIFFDLIGTLVDQTPRGFTLRSGATEWMRLASDYRFGILCDMGPGRHRNIQRVLEEVGVYENFTPELIINASDLPCRLPNRRAFAVAAALAEVEVDRCLFVTNDKRLRPAALAAGMRVENLSSSVSSRAPMGDSIVNDNGGLSATTPLAAAKAAVAEPMAPLLAGEVDVDNGPTFILRGRIVTMNGLNEVIENGRVVVSHGKIACLLNADQPLPPQFNSVPEVLTGGTIYPGLIDLHNHFVYNVLPLWVVPERYQNRTQWPREREYVSNVSLPIRALAGYSRTARSIVRYVEAKALIGGTTTGQGIRTRVQGGIRLFHGAIRNVEETNDDRLPEAGTLVPNLQNNPEAIESFRRALETRTAYFYHLCEGVDTGTRRYFTQLIENDLLRKSLVGIHALALKPEDFHALADQGAKVVWSPFSNLLLYGQTLDLAILKESGLLFSIGSDWSPTGSKNLLQELKVARHVVKSQGAGFNSRDLVRAVTADAAAVTGWQRHLGVLKAGAMADFLVIDGAGGDPYDHLIDATEADVKLVVVHGVARYGDRDFMQTLNVVPERPPEPLLVGGKQKAFQLFNPDSELSDLTVRDASEILRDAMADLPAFLAAVESDNARMISLGVERPQPFVLELDNEYAPNPNDLLEIPAEPDLLADRDNIANSIDLDSFVVNSDNYWPLIEAQNNISDELKRALKEAYQ